MNQRSRNKFTDIVAQYEKLFFLLVVLLSIALILIGSLIIGGISSKDIWSTLFLQLGVGLITGIIITITIHHFFKLKVSHFKFSDRLAVALIEKFPYGVAKEIAERFESMGLVGKNHNINIQIRAETENDETYYVSDIHQEFEIMNTTDRQLVYMIRLSSHILKTEQNIEKKYRDGIYEIESLNIMIKNEQLIKIKSFSNEIDSVQSINEDLIEYDYTNFFSFTKSVVIPGNENAKIQIGTIRYLPKHNGLLHYFSSLPSLGFSVSVSSAERTFLENMSYSFYTSLPGQCCKRTSIIQASDHLYCRDYIIDGLLLNFEGIKIRWH